MQQHKEPNMLPYSVCIAGKPYRAVGDGTIQTIVDRKWVDIHKDSSFQMARKRVDIWARDRKVVIPERAT